MVSTRDFSNFVLKIDFRCPGNANSGVFLRRSYEVQIWGAHATGYNTGGIVNLAKAPPETAFVANQWNTYEITADGDHLIVVLNGKTVLDIHDSKSSSGPFRLQYMKFPMEFRNIKVRPITP